MEEQTYSQNIAEAISRFLTEDGQDFSFNAESGTIRFKMDVGESEKSEGFEKSEKPNKSEEPGKSEESGEPDMQIDYMIEIREEDYIVYMIAPIDANADDERMMAEMAVFVCRINYGLKEGNFELDMRDGEIRYKCFVDCAGITPTQQMVKNSIAWPFVMLQRYIQGIVDVISGNYTGKEAADRCDGFDFNVIREAMALIEGWRKPGEKVSPEAKRLARDYYDQPLVYEDGSFCADVYNWLMEDEEDELVCGDEDLEELVDMIWMDDMEGVPVVDADGRKKIFVNFTSYPSDKWNDRQRWAAECYGKIVDIPFPHVDPFMDEYYVDCLTEYYLRKILELKPSAVLCQGEFCLMYQLVYCLKERNIVVLAACGNRPAEEWDGTKEMSSFRFSRFRKY